MTTRVPIASRRAFVGQGAGVLAAALSAAYARMLSGKAEFRVVLTM